MLKSLSLCNKVLSYLSLSLFSLSLFSQSEKRAVQCGYDLATIRNYVRTLKDRAVLCALRNTNRNNSFKTVVLDKSDNKSKLICETDDFVFVSDFSTYQKHPCTYWLNKQEELHML